MRHIAERIGPAVVGTALMTAAGIIGASLEASPETTAAVVGVTGLATALLVDDEMIQALGAGALATGATQLALSAIPVKKKPVQVAQASSAPKPSNAGDIPPEAVQEALERVRIGMALRRETDESMELVD